MGINVIVDEALLAEAERATGEHDREKLLEKALREMIGRQVVALKTPLQGMLELAGTNPLREDYDYKALRTGGDDDAHR